MIREILLAFIPIFVAVDALGILPIFISFTEGLNVRERRKVIYQSTITALSLTIGFIFLGKGIFKLLGITVGDFYISGGVILFCLAITDILSMEKKTPKPIEELGIVPLGTPLIAGPAVLTTSLMIIPEYGAFPTLISILLNISLVGVVFYFSDALIKIFGDSGTKALSKVTNLLLGAIAVMMIRKGILLLLG